MNAHTAVGSAPAREEGGGASRMPTSAPAFGRESSSPCQPHQFLAPAAAALAATQPTGVDVLLSRAIAGVMRNAQAGELPLFAWTLGLPQHELLQLVERLFPELGSMEPLPATCYTLLQVGTPAQFAALAAWLTAQAVEPPVESVGPLEVTAAARAEGAGVAPLGKPELRWLASALAAAAMGERHLWQDLGLAGRDEVSQLLARYFPGVHAANVTGMRWKKFLFAHWGMAQGLPAGQAASRPPGCGRCEQQPHCFPDLGGDAPAR